MKEIEERHSDIISKFSLECNAGLSSSSGSQSFFVMRDASE